jgi:hypothetical protein
METVLNGQTFGVDSNGSLQCIGCGERVHFEAVCWFGMNVDGNIDDGGVLAHSVGNQLVCLNCDKRWAMTATGLRSTHLDGQLEDIGIAMQCIDYGRIADGPTA